MRSRVHRTRLHLHLINEQEIFPAAALRIRESRNALMEISEMWFEFELRFGENDKLRILYNFMRIITNVSEMRRVIKSSSS